MKRITTILCVSLVLSSVSYSQEVKESIQQRSNYIINEYQKIQSDVENYVGQFQESDHQDLKLKIYTYIENTYGYVTDDKNLRELYGKSYFVDNWDAIKNKK